MLKAVSAVTGCFSGESLEIFLEDFNYYSINSKLPESDEILSVTSSNNSLLCDVQPDILAADFFMYCLANYAGKNTASWILASTGIYGESEQHISSLFRQEESLSFVSYFGLLRFIKRKSDQSQYKNQSNDKVVLEKVYRFSRLIHDACAVLHFDNFISSELIEEITQNKKVAAWMAEKVSAWQLSPILYDVIVVSQKVTLSRSDINPLTKASLYSSLSYFYKDISIYNALEYSYLAIELYRKFPKRQLELYYEKYCSSLIGLANRLCDIASGEYDYRSELNKTFTKPTGIINAIEDKQSPINIILDYTEEAYSVAKEAVSIYRKLILQKQKVNFFGYAQALNDFALTARLYRAPSEEITSAFREAIKIFNRYENSIGKSLCVINLAMELYSKGSKDIDAKSMDEAIDFITLRFQENPMKYKSSLGRALTLRCYLVGLDKSMLKKASEIYVELNKVNPPRWVKQFPESLKEIKRELSKNGNQDSLSFVSELEEKLKLI